MHRFKEFSGTSQNAGEQEQSPIRFTYQFGDFAAMLQCTDERIATGISEAFHHLQIDSRTIPQLKIRAHRSNRSHRNELALPKARFNWSYHFEAGVVSGTHDGRYLSYIRQWTEQHLDRETGELFAWYDEEMEIPFSERSKPLSLPLSVWYNDRGIQIVHAGLLSSNGAGILIAGPAGAGKTTVALACASEGFRFLSDDYAGVQLQPDGSVMGFSLYNSIRLDRKGLNHFDRFSSYAENDLEGKEKSILFLCRIFPKLLAHQTKIRVVLFPKLTSSAETRIVPIEKGKALLRFAYSSLQIPSSGPAFGLSRLSRFLQDLPCFWLELGRDISRIPESVFRLVKEVAP